MQTKTPVKWKEKTLNEICLNIQDGDWIESKNQSNRGIRLIQTGNVGCGIFKDKEEKSKFISEETFKKLNCTEIFENDCLVSRLPDPIGRACLLPKLDTKMITAVDCAILRFDYEKIISKYFIYYSLSNKYLSDIKSNATGSTRQRISRTNLGLINIPLPKIEEQQRIIKFLDKAFEDIDQLTENAKQNLQNAKDLFECYLNQSFIQNSEDWQMKTIEEILSKDKYSMKRGPFGSSLKKSCFVNKGVRVFEQYNPINDDPYWCRYYINNEKFNELKAFVAGAGDLLISCSGVTLGRIVELPNDVEQGVINQALLKIRLNSKIIKNLFFIYFFRSKFMQDKIFEYSSGVAIPNMVGVKELKKIQIPIPTIKTQEKIIKNLDSLQEETKQLEQIYQQKIEQAEELKQSILQKAFNGEL